MWTNQFTAVSPTTFIDIYIFIPYTQFKYTLSLTILANMSAESKVYLFTLNFTQETSSTKDIFTFYGKTTYVTVTVDWTQSGEYAGKMHYLQNILSRCYFHIHISCDFFIQEIRQKKKNAIVRFLYLNKSNANVISS